MANSFDTWKEKFETAEYHFRQGRYDLALKTYQEVLKIQKIKLGDYHSDTLVTQRNIGRVLLLQGKIDEALQISNRVYEAQKRSNTEHPEAIVTGSNIAAMLVVKHEYEEALKIFREVLDISQRTGHDTLDCRQNIASTLHKLGRHQEALDSYYEIYPILEEKFGKDNPDTSILQNNMANIFAELGKYDKAQKIFEEDYEVKKRILGLKDPSTLITRHNLAFILLKRGRLNEALEIFEDVYRYRVEVLGPENPDTISTRTEIAKILIKTGKYEEALTIYEDLKKGSNRSFREELGDIAMEFYENGKLDEALRLCTEICENMSETANSPSDHLTMQYIIAKILKDLGRWEESLNKLKKVYKETVDILGPDHELTLDALSSIASILIELGKYSEAFDRLRKVEERKIRVLGPEHQSVLHTKNKLVQLLTIMGNKEEAINITKEIYQIEKRKRPEHPETLKMEVILAHQLSLSGKNNEALKMLHEALKRQKEAEFPVTDILITKSAIASTLSKLGCHAKALDLYQEILRTQEEIKHKNQDIVVIKLKIADELTILKKHDEALKILTEIYETQKSEPLNLNTLATQNSIAATLKEQKEYSKALEILKDVIKKRTEIQGVEHIDTLNSRIQLGTIHLEQNELGEALKVFEDMYENIKRSNNGDERESRVDHPKTLSLENNIATVYSKMGEYDKALKIFKEVHEKTKEQVGAENWECLFVKLSIASVLAHRKEYSEALAHFYDVYRKTAKSLGRNHPNTSIPLDSIKDIEPHIPKSNLFIAVIKSDAMQVKNLIERGHDINIKDILGNSPLHVAAGSSNIEIMKLLLEHGAFYNIKNQEGDTPLSFADDEECKNLLSSIEGAFESVIHGNIGVVETSVKNIFFMNVKDDAGSTVLHWACNRNDQDIVNFLLGEGADPTVVTNKGNTALHIACSKRNLNIADSLIRHVKENYPIKMADFVNGKTAAKSTTSLHVAAKNGDIEIMKLLIDNGADLSAKNSDGQMPLDLAPKNVVDFFNVSPQKSEL